MMNIYKVMILSVINSKMQSEYNLSMADRVIKIANESGEWDLKELYETIMADNVAMHHFIEICYSLIDGDHCRFEIEQIKKTNGNPCC